MISIEQIIEQIKESLDVLRPKLLAHGGDIEFVKFVDEVCYIRLTGACESCPASLYTLTLFIETELRREVPQVKKVIEFS